MARIISTKRKDDADIKVKFLPHLYDGMRDTTSLRNDEKLAKFLRAYRKLCKKYKMVITSCDLCGGDTVLRVKKIDKATKNLFDHYTDRLNNPPEKHIGIFTPGRLQRFRPWVSP